MSEMTLKEAIEKLEPMRIHWRDFPTDLKAIDLSIRALSLCDKLGLLEGEEVQIQEPQGPGVYWKRWHIGRYVMVWPESMSVEVSSIPSPNDIPQLIRELAAAYEFLQKVGKEEEEEWSIILVTFVGKRLTV